MGRRPRPVLRASVPLAALLTFLAVAPALSASAEPPKTVTAQPASAQPIEVTAERIEYVQESETYEAEGSVVIVQGPLRLTADKATLRMLSGVLVATGHAHLKDQTADLWGDRLEVSVNTEAGVVTNGTFFIKPSNTLMTGRLFQRFSEDHYRVKEGSFTNCDAGDGKIPAWRFRFKDADLNVGESVYLRDVWLCVNDTPVLPLPSLTFPLQTARRSGLLIPTAGFDNRFGASYRQGYFWAINPSQDLTVSPLYYSQLGYGSDFEYRYALGPRHRGSWLVSLLQQQQLPNVSGVEAGGAEKRTRGLVIGTHTQRVNQDLLIRAEAFLVSDPDYLNQLSNSGVQRALPSGESNLLVNRRFAHGNLYFLGQYLQPLQFGGKDTFQRLPEIGHRLANVSPLGGPLLLNMDTTVANFYRDEGFTQNRVDVLPGFSTDVLSIGHVVGFTPHLRLRETYYTKSALSSRTAHRETFWAALESTSRLDRRFRLGEGRSLLHTIEPSVIYEYVPPTDQSDIVQIDDVDDLPKKNLLTYSLRSRLLEHGAGGPMNNWLDLTVAQSYHLGSPQTQGRQFIPPVTPPLGSITQPIRPAFTPVAGRKGSDIWTRAVIGNTTAGPPGTVLEPGVKPLPPVGGLLTLTVDSFFDPYRGKFSQFNTDLRYQRNSLWYLEVGQRYTREGNRVRRGDIWNPISFNEVFAPTPELQFTTVQGAFRAPFGWTVGAKAYYDVKAGGSPEYDVVGLYQNPCKCWSLGLYYLQFPDRTSFNFMINLTGVGWTENFGTAVVRALLSPLLIGERGLPWAGNPYGPYGRSPATPATPAEVKP